MYSQGWNGIVLVGLYLFCSVSGAQEAYSRWPSKAAAAVDMPGGCGMQELQAQLKKELGQLDYCQATIIDLSKIDRLLEAGAGLNFEESMVADIFSITQAEDALVADGFILRGLTGQDRARALANSRAVKRRLFFGALFNRCRFLGRALSNVFRLLCPCFAYGHGHNHVRKIIVGYADSIFLVLQRFLISAPQAASEDVGTLKVLFSRERDIALGLCEHIPLPIGIGWQDPVEQAAQNSLDLQQKRYSRVLQVIDSGCRLAEFVSCFESPM